MKFHLLVTFLCSSLLGFAQDTLLQQDLENVEIKMKIEKQIAFNDPKHYILDFHVGEHGKFLLLKRRSKYFACLLGDGGQLKHSLELDFKPKQFFHDCLGFLHIVSRDSLYQLEQITDTVFIHETNSIDLYDSFLTDCVASNSSNLIFKHLENFNQTTVYYGINRTNREQTTFYRVEDSMLIHSAQDTQDSLDFRDPGETATVSEVRGYDLEFTKYYDYIHDQAQDRNFFNQIVQLPNYVPVFVNHDTTYIFDYMNEKISLLNDTGKVCRTIPILHENNLTILHDSKQGKFYLVNRKEGAQVYGVLSNDNFGVIRNTKLTKHAHPGKAIIYNGFVYYLHKEYQDDNMNKLFRQRI